jgi:hypothetical protein
MITASGQIEGNPLPQTDDSEGSAPLRSELNPLLNPLLGQNLGRWAEVYYTSPPETREQAVEELVRELEAQQMEAQQTVPQDRSFSREEQVPVNDLPSLRRAPSESRASEPLSRRQAMDPETWSTDFLPRDRADQEGFGAKIWDSKLGTALRGRYLLAAFAIAIAGAMVLGYMIRVGTPSPGAKGAQQNPPAVPAPASPATQSGGPAASDSGASSVTELQPTREPVSAARVPHAPAKPGSGSRSAAAGTSAGIPAAATFPAGVSTGMSKAAGSEELAVAKNYLNGNGSNPRDTSEAARWLWKAVAKKNAEAAGLLATLYLEGDGIPKNCDQARLLLDAAARKGIKGAAERLGHLQAFGCQ